LISNSTCNSYTLDVHFYGSWPLALMWPGLDLAVVADLSAAVDSSVGL
jgi:uncharacterized protein (DUF608 family)